MRNEQKQNPRRPIYSFLNSNLPSSLLTIPISLLFIIPLIWMLSAALLRPGTPLPTTLTLIPEDPSFDNFTRIFELAPFFRYTLNSLTITAITVPLTLLTASLAGFGMSQLPKKSQRRWIIISLLVLIVPSIALWSTRFLVYKWLRIIDTPLALIAPALMGTSPFFVLIYYRAFRRIPTAIYDAARLDGAEILQLWRKIALPQALPSTIAVAFLTFIIYWGDFISPLLYLSQERHYTLPIALQLLQQLNRSDWPLLMAGSLWATLIPLILLGISFAYFTRITKN